MKNSDDLNKNVYRKQSLDDTEYDIINDEFDLDNIHFDFDDDDVEHYRRINEEEALKADKKARDRSKNKKPPRKSRTMFFTRRVEDSFDDDAAIAAAIEAENKRRRILAEKRRTNKEIMRVTYLMVILFLGMISYFIYFNAVSADDIVNNVHNSRLAKLEEQVIRGNILSADGKILAQTVTKGDGSTYRYYPYGNVYAHVIGTSEINKSGVELSADYSLLSSDIQPLQKIINDISGQKSQGNTVVTTLDSTLQQIAYDALGDNQGVVIAIEPSTGKILAMVSKPDYDPNTLVDEYNDIISDSSSKVLLNQATQGLFVPGSIFKIVTTLAYLRSGGSIEDYSYSCSGKISLETEDGSSYLKCYNGTTHGTLSLIESFAKSCNSSFASLGLSIDIDVMNSVAEDLLFNQTLPTSFTTSSSKFGLSEDDSDWVIGATAIGQGNTSITPLHALMLVSAIANGGTLMEPYVIDHIENADGSVVDKTMPESYGQLISAMESATMTELMKSVVQSGTATALSGKSYSVAGKTGTAEISGSGNNAWFVGFAPADNPEIAICVLVEDTTGTGSTQAVPIAAKLFEAYLNN